MSDRRFVSLVTGGTGFLGQRLVRQLLEDGAEVRCLVRPGTDVEAFRARCVGQAPVAGELHCFPGTLARPGALAEELKGVDAVYHLAAALGGGAAVLFANNVVPFRGLLRAAAEAKVGRFVLVSSLAVHGTARLRSGDTLDESIPLDPAPHLRDPYAYSKIEQEKLAWEAHREGGLPLVVVRPGVIYGPGRDPLSNRVGLRLGGLVVKMGGSQRVPYTFVGNCAAAVRLAGTVPGVDGESFNVVDDDLPRARTLLRQYRREVSRVWVVPVPRLAIGPLSGFLEWYHKWSEGQLPAVLTRYKSAAHWKRLNYSNAKAKARLGWVPQVGFGEGLRCTFESLRPPASRLTSREVA